MHTNILWSGKEYYSLENCLIDTKETGSQITSTIVGSYQGTIYKVDYQIKTNERWETVFAAVSSRHNGYTQCIQFESDGKGHWKKDGQPAGEFDGCIDVDIKLTPFTNTLPIRRLQLHQGQSKDIRVIYCDLLEQLIIPVHQHYRRVGANEYHYENIPNDFEANLLVDELGLVIDYPGLFVRTAIVRET